MPWLIPRAEYGDSTSKVGFGKDHLNSSVCPDPKPWEQSIYAEGEELQILYTNQLMVQKWKSSDKEGIQ